MRKLSIIMPGLLAVMVTVMFFIFSSCDKSTEPEPKPEGSLIGSWQMTTINLHDTPYGEISVSAAQFLAMSETGATSSILQFNEDGSAAVITTYEEAPQDTIPGTWSRDGDQLAVAGAGIDTTVTVKIDGNTLSLSRIMPINFTPESPKQDVLVEMIYNRVK